MHLQLDNQKIINEYLSGISANKLAHLYNISQWKIFDILNKNKIKIRSHKDLRIPIDENFFEKIDNHQKAQILGLIYADGCINQDKKYFKYKMIISLAREDEYYLYQIRKLMKSETKICQTQKTNSYKPGNLFSTFSSSNQKICNDLLKLGVHPRKSLDLDFPNENQVPTKYLSSFLLGLFEGDGCFCYNEEKGAFINICCTKEFGEILIKKIKEILNINSQISKQGKIYNFRISGNVQSFIFMDWLYKNSSEEFRMIRKYNKYLEIKNIYNKKLEYFKTPEYKINIQHKKNEERKKLNGKIFYEFYTKSPEGKIYFSNRSNRFSLKFGLRKERFGKLIKGRIKEYKGWTIPSEEEIRNAKSNNNIENVVFEWINLIDNINKNRKPRVIS